MKETFTNGIEEAFDNLYTKGAFFTVGDEKKANTMTISWGSIGYMWRKPMFMAMIRESRYSNEFLGLGETYTVSIPYGDNKKAALGICGSKSGRDIDKEKEANIKFIPGRMVSTPVIEGCEKYYECKIVLKQEIDFNGMKEEVQKDFYPENETKHILYFGEIVAEY